MVFVPQEGGRGGRLGSCWRLREALPDLIGRPWHSSALVVTVAWQMLPQELDDRASHPPLVVAEVLLLRRCVGHRRGLP